MRILVIDAQGGGIGKQLISAIKQELPDAAITAIGTNSSATSAMLKAGADEAATGENAVVVCSKKSRRNSWSDRHCNRRFSAWRNHSENGALSRTE